MTLLLVCLLYSLARTDRRGSPSGSCRTRSSGFIVPTGALTQDCTVLDGFYGKDGECQYGPGDCVTCDNNGGCTSCPHKKALGCKDGRDVCVEECKETDNGDLCAECDLVIDGAKYCSKCTEALAPLEDQCISLFCLQKGDGVCLKCSESDGYFLYEGGCYTTKHGPGKRICKTADKGLCTVRTNGLKAVDGKCGKCHTSCRECTREDDPAACTACGMDYYKKSNSDERCDKCLEGCAACEYSNARKMVVWLLVDGVLRSDACETDIPQCDVCGSPGTCYSCKPGYFVTPEGDCIQDCSKLGNFYVDNGRCEPCDSSCKTCSGGGLDQCTKCPPEMILLPLDSNSGGRCVPKCNEQKGPSGCETCGARISGNSYCFKCNKENEAPLDGECIASGPVSISKSRVRTASVAFCVNIEASVCKKCNSGYFV